MSYKLREEELYKRQWGEYPVLAKILDQLEDSKEGVLIEGVYPNGMGAYYGFGM